MKLRGLKSNAAVVPIIAELPFAQSRWRIQPVIAAKDRKLWSPVIQGLGSEQLGLRSLKIKFQLIITHSEAFQIQNATELAIGPTVMYAI